MSNTQQPTWNLVANLGDVNVAEHGGFLVYVDATGVYAPEVELYEPDDDDADEDALGGTRYRFILERNPAGEWWYGKLAEVAQSAGGDVSEYHEDLASGNPVRVAQVYRDVVGHFGPFEFDQYPVRMTEAEAQARYSARRLGGRLSDLDVLDEIAHTLAAASGFDAAVHPRVGVDEYFAVELPDGRLFNVTIQEVEAE